MSDIPFMAEHEGERSSSFRDKNERSLSLKIKRAFDVVAATALLIVIAPVMLAIAAAIKLDGGTIIYRHNRIGLGGRPFLCFKFRTMVQDADRCLAAYLETNAQAAAEWAHRRKLSKDPRVTRIGAILRKTSLDELPQLFNVIRGEMSLVGPRPVVQAELDQHYGGAAAAYMSCRPGLTGLWQVSGRSDTCYETRVALDTRYVREWSLLGDIKILAKTLPAVVARRGAV